MPKIKENLKREILLFRKLKYENKMDLQKIIENSNENTERSLALLSVENNPNRIEKNHTILENLLSPRIKIYYLII